MEKKITKKRMPTVLKITEAMKKKLSEPLPPEAIERGRSDGLSSIKSIYITERLNEVFGIGGWTAKSEIIEKEPQIVVKTTLRVPKYGIEFENFGGNENRDRGDAYKSAVTDSVTKIASWLGIGAEVYKRKVEKVKQKLVLLPESSEFREAIRAMKNGVQLEQIKQKYEVSEEVEKLLKCSENENS